MGSVFGFLCSTCFAMCGIPQAWKTIKEGNADGTSTWMLTLWMLGELFGIAYAIIALGSPFWLLFNYITSTVTLLPIIYFKLKDISGRQKKLRETKSKYVQKM